jgi:hypothetical protein
MRDYDNRQAVIEQITKELLKKREELFERIKYLKSKLKALMLKK